MTGAATPGNFSAQIFTCSFRGDLAVCRLLCESIDRYVPEHIGHTLFVPERDMGLFADLTSSRRRLLSQESLLPRGFWKLPLPGPEWRARLHLPRRDVFLTPYSPPVRGWIAQQIMKLSATAEADEDIVIHVDSDNALVRPLRHEHVVQDGKVHFYRNPQMVPLDTHRVWHRAASRLLGLPPSDFHGAEYIEPVVVWKRSVLRAAVARIETVAGVDWRIALARTPHFAEFVLYGVFADRVLGLENAGLFATDQTLCHARWSGTFAGAQDVDAFVAGIGRGHIACNMQSTIPIPMEMRREILRRVAERAARQDAEA